MIFICGILQRSLEVKRRRMLAVCLSCRLQFLTGKESSLILIILLEEFTTLQLLVYSDSTVKNVMSFVIL